VRKWKARSRRLVDELVDAGTWARPALAGLLVAGAVSLLQVAPIAPGIAGAVATVIARVYEYARFRSARDRAIASVGRAALEVLDAQLWLGLDRGRLTLWSGEPATLRNLAAATRAGNFRQQFAPAVVFDASVPLEGLVRQFKEGAALGLPELASLRAAGRELVDALEAAASIATELREITPRLVHAHPRTAAVMKEQANAIVDRMAEPLDRAARFAERLERRWDDEAATAREREREAERARIREERRCAHGATLRAARSLREAVDMELRSQEPWSVKAQRLTLARERFAGVSNAMNDQMDHPTLELARDAFEHIADAMIAVNIGTQAETALKVPRDKRPDEAEQVTAVKLAEASGKLTVALESIERDVTALEQLQVG
jgi:hypothetical protein